MAKAFADFVKTIKALVIIAKLSQPTSQLNESADIKCRREGLFEKICERKGHMLTLQKVQMEWKVILPK